MSEVPGDNTSSAPRLLSLVGEMCSGKDTWGGVLQNLYGYKPQSTSDIVRSYIAKYSLGEPTRDLTRQVSTVLRDKNGPDYLVKTAIDQSNSDKVVITGLYALPEALYVRRCGGYILRVAAREGVRMQRMIARGRSGEIGDAAEFMRLSKNDLTSLNTDQRLADIIRLADAEISGEVDAERADLLRKEADEAFLHIQESEVSGRYRSYFDMGTERMLTKGRIVGQGELPCEMIERVITTINEADSKHSDADVSFGKKIGKQLDDGKIVFSTPILTNAGRHVDRPLSACTVLPIGLDVDYGLLKNEISFVHQQGMGTGFNLDRHKNPLRLLNFLNNSAIDSSNSGNEDRPVGNIAIMSIYNPMVTDFINIKDTCKGEWKFNISVSVDKEFMVAVKEDSKTTQSDGTLIPARELFDKLCASVLRNAEPGLIFLDRINERNPAPELGSYEAVAPCAEVGLIPGEVCEFGYINLAKFISYSGSCYDVDTEGLAKTSRLLTRALDDLLDVTYENIDNDLSRQIIEQKRKIGIGICGLSDALAIANLSYDSKEATTLVSDLVALINYSSKLESVKLAASRGSCGIIKSQKSRYLDEPAHIVKLFGSLDSAYVQPQEWIDLADTIKRTRNLRNISTTAIPPTGRSALVIGASTGIEPYFNIRDISIQVFDKIADRRDQSFIKTANEICVDAHIAMAAAAQRFCDESISKTINLPASATVDDIKHAFLEAYEKEMNGITIYVDGSVANQPKDLK